MPLEDARELVCGLEVQLAGDLDDGDSRILQLRDDTCHAGVFDHLAQGLPERLTEPQVDEPAALTQLRGDFLRGDRTVCVGLDETEGGGDKARANVLAGEHIAFWNRTHTNEETGVIPAVRAQRLIAEGRNRLRPGPNEKVLRLFLSRHVSRKVELGCRIDFMGRKWRIAKTLKKTVWIAIRPENRGFYVLEERPDPTNPVVPRILLAHRF